MDFNGALIQFGHGILVNQVFSLCAGVLLLLLGAAILYTLVTWRLRAQQFEGEVIGVRRRGPYFHAVYRYAVPGGPLREATSIQGERTVQDLSTGRHVAIQVMAQKPDEAREQHATAAWCLGLGSLLCAVWVLYQTVAVSRHGLVVWILILLAVVLVARWIWGRVTRLMANRQPAVPASPWSSIPIERAESFPDSGTTAARINRSGSNSRRTGVVFLVTGLVVYGVAAFAGHNLMTLRGGIRTQGTVVDVVWGTSGNRNSESQFPVVQFTQADGTVVRFHDRTGETPSPYKAGDKVPVLYRPGTALTPSIDRGASNWMPIVMLILLGTCFAGMGVLCLRGQ